MSEGRAFVERALEGSVLDLDEEVAAAVEAWHRSASSRPLHEWLGMTEREYALFVDQPELLSAILMARRYGIDLAKLAEANEADALAARGIDAAQLAALVGWLRRTRRMK